MKNNKNIYAAPTAEVIFMEAVDVITESLPGDSDTVGPWVTID